jgi:hypothetical protein
LESEAEPQGPGGRGVGAEAKRGDRAEKGKYQGNKDEGALTCGPWFVESAELASPEMGPEGITGDLGEPDDSGVPGSEEGDADEKRGFFGHLSTIQLKDS